MPDTLEQLNNFLVKNTGKKENQEKISMVKIREELMSNDELSSIVDAFINGRPPELEINQEQIYFMTWTFLAYLKSMGIIKITKQ